MRTRRGRRPYGGAAGAQDGDIDNLRDAALFTRERAGLLL